MDMAGEENKRSFSQNIYHFFHKRIYQPDLFAIFFNDSYFIRKGIYKGIKHYSPHFKGKLLDFGCGRKPYQNLFEVESYTGVDMAREDDWTKSYADVLYDGKRLPFENEMFDGILSTEVIEHIPDAEPAVEELFRVLKPGGKLLITVPFVWNEHGMPYDYLRYTSAGITHLLQKKGFKVKEVRKSSTFIETLFQLWCIYLTRFLNTRYFFLNLFLNFCFIFPFTLTAIILSWLLPNDKTLFINDIVYAEKPGTKEV